MDGGKRHTMREAREAKQQIKTVLSERFDVTIGIGQTAAGDYAVVVYVESEQVARSLPPLDACVPVEVSVIGKVHAR